MKLVEEPQGSLFPSTPDYPSKQWRLWGPGPRLWCSDDCVQSQTGGLDYLQRVSLCSRVPGGPNPVIYESERIEEQNSFLRGAQGRSSSHFVAFYRTLLMKNASLSSRLPGYAFRDFHIAREQMWNVFRIPYENDMSKTTIALTIRLFQQNLSHTE